MAQANVAREPSMDEILASIRRIIESNEPPNGETPQMESDRYEDEDPSEEIHLTVDDEPSSISNGFQSPSEAHGPSFPIQGRFQEPELSRHDVPPLSLADVAARVRAAAERNSVTREPEVPIPSQTATLSRPVPEPASAPMAATVTTAAVAGLTVAPPMQAEAAVKKVEAMPEKVEPVQPADVRQAQAPLTVQSAEKITGAPPEIAAQARQSVAIIAEKEIESLVSPIVSQQVARSFEDLAFAVDEGQRRSFDEIATEMMRPMLQEWLDDNLPTLVERLVREEIERVARGSRR